MCIGGRIGAMIDIDGTGDTTWARLAGRKSRQIHYWSKTRNEKMVGRDERPQSDISRKTEQQNNLVINDGFDEVINLNVNDLVSSWQNTLDMTGGSRCVHLKWPFCLALESIAIMKPPFSSWLERKPSE